MTPYEQYCACTTLEELQEVKPLLEIERDNAKNLYNQYIKEVRKNQASADEQRKLMHNVPELIKAKGYEISFPEG